MKNSLALPVCFAVVTLLAGCGKSDDPLPVKTSDEAARKAAARAIEKAIEEEAVGKVRVDITDGKIEIKGRDEGKDFSFAAGGKVALPKPFPEDIPRYPDARLKMARNMVLDDFTVIFATGDGVSEVTEYYRRKMDEEGWSFTGEAALEGEQFLGYVKDNRSVSVVVAPDKEGTILSIAYKVRY